MSTKCPKCHSDNPDTVKFCGECGTQLPSARTSRPEVTATLQTPSKELTTGSTFANRYQIIEELGHGGMGKVFKVFDKETNSKVALKLIKPEVAADKNTIERFRNELNVARGISHKHICRMYDLGRDADNYFITMEYVSGEDLRSLIRRTKRLDIGTAISIAKQVCEGLAEAHRLGVVHRDLKPSNIMIDWEGDAKIMDFGIARSLRTKGITGPGVVIGTPEYMSPEQVDGKEADQRADLYSLSIILYEMVTGTVPFEGETAFAVGLKHKSQPPENPKALNTQIPDDLNRLILKGLEKEKEKRFQTAEEVLSELAKIEQGLTTKKKVIPPKKPLTSKEITVKFRLSKLTIPALVLIVFLVIFGYFLFRGGPKSIDIKISRTQQMTRDPGLEIDPDLSPDGKMIAYCANISGKMDLYVRQVAGGGAILLTKTFPYDCRWPRWSPDGAQILFQSQRSIYVLPALGGTPKKVVEPPPGKLADSRFWPLCSAAWSPDSKQISYSESPNSIRIISTEGEGARKIAEAFEPHSLSWSPDGSTITFVSGNRDFVFGVPNIGNPAPSSIWLVPAKGGGPIRVTDNNYLNTSPIWTPDGRHLLFVSNQGGSRDIYLQSLGSSLKPMGSPERLTTGLNAHSISISSDGDKLAYSVFAYNSNIWSIRIPKGESISISEAQPVTTGNQEIEGIDVSLDGKWLAFDSNISGNQDIYKMPTAGGETEQLTSDPSDDFLPVWSPDGKEIAFYSLRKGNRDIFLMMADGGRVQQLTNDPAQERHPDWSPDGTQLVFHSDKTGRRELYVISRKTKDSNWGVPRQLTFEGGMIGKWSPDGSLIAYNISDSSIRVIAPEGGESRTLIQSQDSTGLLVPLFLGWASDSKTVYYIAYDAEQHASFWSVPISGGKPRLLVAFDDPTRQSRRYEFATDGQRFFFTLGRYESDVWVGDLLIRKKR